MTTIPNNPIISNANVTRYGKVWMDVYDMQKPDIWKAIIPYFGKGVGLAEWTSIAGNTITFGSERGTVYEEGSLFKLVTVDEIAVAAEGADITVTLPASEYDANSASYVAVGDAFVIPAKYLQKPTGTKAVKPELYQVITKVGVGVATVYTCRPQLLTVHLHVAVPANTQLQVMSGNWANEAAGATPKSSGWYTRTFNNTTVRTSAAQGGSTQSMKRYYEELEGGGVGIWTKNSAEMNLRHTKAISDQMWLGSGVTNTALTMVNRNLAAIAVTGTVGVLQHLVSRAMPQYYTAAYDKPCFEDVKPALESQGVVEKRVLFAYGSELGRQIENLNLDFIKEFSGGTDFERTMQQIDTTFKAVKYNGVYFQLKELPSLSDPVGCGAASHDDQFISMGFMIPDVDVNVKQGADESPISLKNLTLGFKSYNGEDRTRIIKRLPSMADMDSNIAVDSWDDTRLEELSEFRVIFNAVNQAILVQDDRILV